MPKEQKDWLSLIPGIIVMINEKRSAQYIADAVGLKTEKQLRNALARYRVQGKLDIPYLQSRVKKVIVRKVKVPKPKKVNIPKAVPVGTQRDRMVKGVSYRYIKQPDGQWRSAGRSDGTPVTKRGRKAVEKTQKQLRREENMRRKEVARKQKEEIAREKALMQANKTVYMQPKKREKVLVTKVRSPDDYKTIKINNKLSIQVLKTKDTDEAIREYHEKVTNRIQWQSGMKSKTYK